MPQEMDGDGTVYEAAVCALNRGMVCGTKRARRPYGQGHVLWAVPLLWRRDVVRQWIALCARSRWPGKRMFNVFRAQFRLGQM